MTDPIPQEYLDEAVRRANAFTNWNRTLTSDDYGNLWIKLVAATLQELGWKPPVDPVEQRAKEIAARAYGCDAGDVHHRSIVYQAALIALREGMGEHG